MTWLCFAAFGALLGLVAGLLWDRAHWRRLVRARIAALETAVCLRDELIAAQNQQEAFLRTAVAQERTTSRRLRRRIAHLEEDRRLRTLYGDRPTPPKTLFYRN